MRSLFDQYSSPENRLTHALLSALDKDRRLLRSFVTWLTGRKVRAGLLEVVSQGFPGDEVQNEDEAEQRGIPDGCITDGSGWALLLESKFAAKVGIDQLRRHLRTAVRHNIDRPELFLLTVGHYTGTLPARTKAVQWLEIYAWLRRQSRHSEWAGWVAEYLEIAEAKEAQAGYFKEGTLTVFTGIPFAHEPYNYPQAKRLLGLLRDELVSDQRLARRLRADLVAPGRGAIKGTKADRVWDYIPLKVARKAKSFTHFPHLTFSIHGDRVETYVTVPNGVRRAIRRGILGNDYASFEALVEHVTRNLSPLVRLGATPMIVLVQRHYPSQSAPAVADATLRFDPRTAFPNKVGDGKAVKYQPQWLQGVYETMRHRRTNLQLQVGVDFQYSKAPICGTPKIVRAISDAWLACHPVLDRALN